MADYSLPELPYDYAALEPYISGEIMELHHDKHHATYVKGINTAVDQLSEMRDKEEFTFLGTLEKNLAFHLGRLTVVTSPLVISRLVSTPTSGRSTSSARSSRPTPSVCRVPAGRC